MKTLNQYFRERFGTKVYKLALDAGMTCPNRDGTLAYGGCTFCASGSSHFAVSTLASLDEQIALAKARVARKITNPDARYFAYFQSYTNTYTSRDHLENL